MARSQSLFMPKEGQSMASQLSTSDSAKDRRSHSSGAIMISEPSADGLRQTQEDDEDFDVYRFLNDGGSTLLRDPILQQMTVIKYEGDIDNASGYFHGQGKLVSTLGYTYTGGFEKGLMQGNGKIEWSDGTVYEGTFKQNVISGSGRYSWSNGDWYEGEVDECVRHGSGTFFYKSLQETYEGEWYKGMRHGTGVLKYLTDGGSQYSGAWVRDKRNGTGTMIYPGGGTYEGEWKDDIRHGTGYMVWKRENVVIETYRGDWLNGIPHGNGTSTYIRPPAATASPSVSPSMPDSHFIKNQSAINSYTGEYDCGMRNGFGTFIYDDGSKYEGNWVKNHKHGEGKYTNASGVVYFGQFAEGNAVSPVAEGSPETSVASPLPLYIRDLLGEGENNVQEALTAVQSVVSRNTGTLKKVFQYYSSLETAIEVINTPSNWRKTRTQGTISVLQFLRFCNDARLITRQTSIVVIDKLLLAFKDRNATTLSSSYVTGEAETSGPILESTKPDLSQSRESIQMESRDGQPTPQRERGSISSHRSSKTRKSTGTREPYGTPWERYAMELHMYSGELNFREFVEAIVRIAHNLYDTQNYGSVSQKLSLVVEEHLPLTCSAHDAAPLFPLTREHKAVVVPHLSALERCFCSYAQASGLGHKAVTAAPKLAGTTITVRQFALMLKDIGAVDGERLSLTMIPRMAPYDAHPKMSTQIAKKQVMTNAPLSLNATQTSERGSTLSLEGEPRFVEGAESKYRSRVGMSMRSKGIQNTNIHATLCMERELTFPEFVELVLMAGEKRSTEAVQAQRVQAFLTQYVAPYQQRLLV